MPLQHTIIVTLLFTLKYSYILGQTLTDTCYCPNSTEFQNPDPIYSNLRSTARKLCRTQQLLSAQIYRIPGKKRVHPHMNQKLLFVHFVVFFSNSPYPQNKHILHLVGIISSSKCFIHCSMWNFAKK